MLITRTSKLSHNTAINNLSPKKSIMIHWDKEQEQEEIVNNSNSNEMENKIKN